ncbi:MAG: hypothetical protein P1S60_13460, partial [Anaerolineae bacterium]|nr:hypothetical protein [Anaerolineae bacterium]
LPTVKLGAHDVTRLTIGGNPFSGFSHQTPERDQDMVNYFTTARIKETLQQAEALGVTTFLGRVDKHIRRILMEYWDEGGTIQWLAQTAPEFTSLQGNIAGAISTGATAIYLHGGQLDFFYAQKQYEPIYNAIQQIKTAGLPAGVAGHTPQVHLWADENLDLDFHMCSYYNPTPRDDHAEHIQGSKERFDDSDRDAMAEVIHQMKTPVIHYKVFAAGRKTPEEALGYVARNLRPQDAVCIGIFPKDNPNMLAEDIDLLDRLL